MATSPFQKIHHKHLTWIVGILRRSSLLHRVYHGSLCPCPHYMETAVFTALGCLLLLVVVLTNRGSRSSSPQSHRRLGLQIHSAAGLALLCSGSLLQGWR